MNRGKPYSYSDQNRQTVMPELTSDLSTDPCMAPVIETFMSEFPVLIERITASASQKYLPNLKTSAHKLKGAAGSAGFARIFDLADQVEGLAEQGHLEAALPLIESLNRIYLLSTPTATPAVKP